MHNSDRLITGLKTCTVWWPWGAIHKISPNRKNNNILDNKSKQKTQKQNRKYINEKKQKSHNSKLKKTQQQTTKKIFWKHVNKAENKTVLKTQWQNKKHNNFKHC